jgi:hypothetical protein
MISIGIFSNRRLQNKTSKGITAMVPGLTTICAGVLIPHTKGGKRLVTRCDWRSGRIYMKTGKSSVKYNTVKMLHWAYNLIKSGRRLDSTSLKRQFPKEASQGTCVFSMTGGVLEFLGLATRLQSGRRTYYV